MVETSNLINFWSLAFKWPPMFLPSFSSSLGVFPMIFFPHTKTALNLKVPNSLNSSSVLGTMLKTWLSSLYSL